MPHWDQRYLGFDRFPEALSALEIEEFFGLSAEEREVVLRRRRPTNRLGVALQVGYLRMTGRPLNSVQRIPLAILSFIGGLLDQPMPQLATIRALSRTSLPTATSTRALRGVILSTPS